MPFSKHLISYLKLVALLWSGPVISQFLWYWTTNPYDCLFNSSHTSLELPLAVEVLRVLCCFLWHNSQGFFSNCLVVRVEDKGTIRTCSGTTFVMHTSKHHRIIFCVVSVTVMFKGGGQRSGDTQAFECEWLCQTSGDRLSPLLGTHSVLSEYSVISAK